MRYSGGYILNGKYVRKTVNVEALRTPDSAMFKSGDHDRQRKDYAKEIIQAYSSDGSPNEDFINAYPEESKEYGFLPTDEQLKKEG